MTATTSRAPFSDLAHRFAEVTSDIAMAHFENLALPIGGPAWEPVVDELETSLTLLCGGCSGRSSMVLWEALDEMNATYEFASAAKLPLDALGRINSALALLMLLMRRHLERNPAAGTHH